MKNGKTGQKADQFHPDSTLVYDIVKREDTDHNAAARGDACSA